MEAELRELKEKGNGMDISERKKYGSDNEVEECPKCGCRHREEIGRFDDGRTVCVTRMCRYCGLQFVTTYYRVP